MKKKSLGRMLIETINESIKNPQSMSVYRTEIDIKSARKSLGLNQSQFAKAYGFNLNTLREWERGTQAPDKAVISYISCILKKPKLIANIIKSCPRGDYISYDEFISKKSVKKTPLTIIRNP